ncbi:MAG: tandem-95 repeat protein [Chloroflexota bacterium]
MQRFIRTTRYGLTLLVALFTLAMYASQAQAATITVNTTNTDIAVDGGCSLTEAIINANDDAQTNTDCSAGSGADIIELSAATYSYISGANSTSALPYVSSRITINGNGATIVGVAEAPSLAVIFVSGYLTLQDTTLTGGTGGGIAISGGKVELNNCTVANNSNDSSGGGIENHGGNVTLNDSTVSNNYANGSGGGIVNFGRGVLTINNSIVSDNVSVNDGGGIWNYGDQSSQGVLVLNQSTVRDNAANSAGGIFNNGNALISLSTVRGNSGIASSGGIFNSGDLKIVRSIIDGNTSNGHGGGISHWQGGTGVTLDIQRSTIANNTGIVGGGIYNAFFMVLTDSTVSGNTGGGIFNESEATVTNSTISQNTHTVGGGISNRWILNLSRTIISGNIATDGISEIANEDPRLTQINADDFNILGQSSQTNSESFHNFTPTGTDVSATSDGTSPTALASILDTALASNGGSILTHVLPNGSPAIDAAPSEACSGSAQNPVSRNTNGDGTASSYECDIGAFEAPGIVDSDVNQPPTVADDNHSTSEDNTLSVASPGVLANDIDADNDPITSILVDQAIHGTVILALDGSFTYEPNPNFHGLDSFTYKAIDGTVDSTVATVFIMVYGVNDVATTIDDTYVIDEDNVIATPAPGPLYNDENIIKVSNPWSGSDIDGDPVTFVAVTTPEHGTINDPWWYEPDANFNGEDSFTYKVNDGTEDSNVATIRIIINPVNDAPVASDDTATTNVNSNVTIRILDNDNDIDVDLLSLETVDATSANNGSIVTNADNSVTYNPPNGFVGTDTFSYTINDGNGGTDSAMVTVDIIEAPLSSLMGPHLKDIMTVAVGNRHSCALTNVGSVLCWGSNSNGELGYGRPADTQNTPKYVSGLTSGVIAITAGNQHTCALVDPDGDGLGGVKCWGRNKEGQLGNGDHGEVTKFTPVDVAGLTSGVRDITAGNDHTCALVDTNGDELGSVKCWGSHKEGQLGIGEGNGAKKFYVPQEVLIGANVKAIDAGEKHTCTVTTTNVLCWGLNAEGQLGNGSINSSSIPEQVNGLNGDVRSISAGSSHTCAVSDADEVKCWGSNSNLQLGRDIDTDKATSPVIPEWFLSDAQPESIKSVSAGEQHTCVITTSNAVFCWGSSRDGRLGNGKRFPDNNSNAQVTKTPQKVIGVSRGVIHITTGEQHNCAVVARDGDGSGNVSCWGIVSENFGHLGHTENLKGNASPGASYIDDRLAKIAGWRTHTCAIVDNDNNGIGTVQCWGDGDSGHLGNSGRLHSLRAVSPDGLGTDNAIDIGTGRDHSCALILNNTSTTKGGVKCWGANGSRQIGVNGNPNRQLTPVYVPSATSDVIDIAVGGAHNCALFDPDDDGKGNVKCWGDTTGGQLGIGEFNLVFQSTPRDVVGLDEATFVNTTSGVKAIAAADDLSCAVIDHSPNGDDEIRCWGRDSGPGGSDNNEPVSIGTVAEGIAAIDVGADHACVLTDTGGVKCWGNNSRGKLGTDDTTPRNIPTDVVGLSSGAEVQAISVGDRHTCALSSSGGVKCWGGGNYYLLGNDDYNAWSKVPVDVNGLQSGVTAIAAGARRTCVSTSNGMKCWGSNLYGELGNGVATEIMYAPGHVIAPNPNHPPIAVDDFVSTNINMPVVIDILANDTDEDATDSIEILGNSFFGTPNGSVQRNDNNTFAYTPDTNFVGVDIIRYTIRDDHGVEDNGSVFVTVSPVNPDDPALEEVAQAVDPAQETNFSYTNSQDAAKFTHITVPAGATTEDVVLVYTETAAPTTGGTPAGFELAGRHFTLDAYLNGSSIDDFAFVYPTQLTISYGDIPGQNPETLTLRYWEEGGEDWSTDGISCNPPDLANQTITCAINHLTEFAIFAQPGAQTGDVNCSGDVSGLDGYFILQWENGVRADSGQCATANDTVYLSSCDVNGDGNCTGFDGFLLLQCEAGISNGFCPIDSQ